MADQRDAKLSIETELTGADKAAAATAATTEELKKQKAAAEDTAEALQKQAAAAAELETEQERAAAATAAAADATERAGETTIEVSREAASAAAEAANATREVADAARDHVEAAGAAGEAAAKAADETSAGAGTVKKSLEDVVAQFNRWGDAARESGKELSVDEAVGAVREFVAGILESDAALVDQRASIVAVSEEMVSLFNQVNSAAEASGQDLSKEAEIVARSVRGIAAVVAELDEEIARVADEAPGEFGEITRATVDFKDAANIAIDEVNEKWKKYQDTLRVTPADITAVSQAVEASRIALEQRAAAGQKSTEEELAIYARLKEELQKLTGVSNALTNAGKDNALGLKETHVQVAQVGQAVQALTSQLGPTASKVGAVFNAVSQFGGKLKDLGTMLKTINATTVGTGTTAAAAAVQLAAVVAVFATAVKVGLDVAKTNRENADSLRDVGDAAKEVTEGAWAGFLDRLDGIQNAAQNVLASLDQMGRISWDGGEFVTTTASAESQVRDLNLAMNELALGVLDGRSAILLYNVAMRDGLKEEQARALAMADSAKVLKFYNDSTKAGHEGHKLWAQGLRESQGETAKFEQFIARHNAQMQAAVRVYDAQTKSAEANRAAQKELRKELDTLDRLLPIFKDGEAGAVEEIAKRVDDLAKKTRGLSEAERDRLDILTDLLRRGADMTEHEKLIAAGLLGQIRAGKEASAVLNALTRLQITYEQAQRGTTAELNTSFAVLQALTRQWELNSQQIRTAIGQAQAQLDATDNLTEAQRRQHQATLDGLRAMDDAREQSRRLESDRIKILKTAEDELRNRSRETTAALQQRLRDLEQLVPLSSEYGGVVKDLGGQLQQILDRSVSVSQADRNRLQVIIDLVSKGHELTAAQRELAVSLIQSARAGEEATSALTALARIQSDLDRAQDGSTARINTMIGVIRSLSAEWGTNSVAIRAAVGELQNLLNTTDGLTNAQREHIQAIIDATQKQLDSAAALKQSVADLITSVQSQTAAYVNQTSAVDAAMKAAGVLSIIVHGQADEYTLLNTNIRIAIKAAEDSLITTESLTEAERLRALAVIQIAKEIDALQTREAAYAKVSSDRVAGLQAEIAALEELIRAKSGDQQATQKTITQQLNEAASVDYLRMKQASLTQEMEAQLQSWSASRDATERQVDERTKLLEVITKEKTAQELLRTETNNVTTATGALFKTIEDGRVVWTNLGTAQKEAANVANQAAEEFRNTITIKYRDGTIAIREVGEAAGETATAIAGVADVAEDAAPRVAAAFDQLVAQSMIDKVAIPLGKLNDLLKDLQVNADGVEGSWDRMGRRFIETGQMAATAAGQKMGAPK